MQGTVLPTSAGDGGFTEACAKTAVTVLDDGTEARQFYRIGYTVIAAGHVSGGHVGPMPKAGPEIHEEGSGPTAWRLFVDGERVVHRTKQALAAEARRPPGCGRGHP